MMSLMEMICEGDVYTIREAVEDALTGSNPGQVLEALVEGLRLVGDRFQRGEAFLPELMMAGETFKEAMDVLSPALRDRPRQYLGKIVLGTVRGDVHDIGKNLVALMLEGAGFEVVDLGVDVAPEAFVRAVGEHQPQLVGMSALLTTTMLQMETTIKALEAAGQRDSVGVLVGGAPVSERFAKAIGADAYGNNAAQAVEKAIALLSRGTKPPA